MSQAAFTAIAARRSSRFVSWTRAWRAGLVPYDELPDEIALDEEHLVADAPGTWTDVPLREALSVLSKLHPDEIRLVLPAPGDPIGLPGPGEFTGAALLAGEGVIAGRLGFVPEVREYTSGSGDTFVTVLWRTYHLPTDSDSDSGTGRRRCRSRRRGRRPERRDSRRGQRADQARCRAVASGTGRRDRGAATTGRRRRVTTRVRPARQAAVREGQRGRPNAVTGRRERSGRRDQQLRGPRSRRCATPTRHRLPPGARRGVQRTTDLDRRSRAVTGPTARNGPRQKIRRAEVRSRR